MKNFVLIILVGVGLIACSSTLITTEPHKVIAGIGIDSNIVLKKTTRDEVIKFFGHDFTEKNLYVKLNPTDSIVASNILRYDKTGLAFEFRIPIGLYSIIIDSTFDAMTEKGIHMNVSTMQNVMDAYGKVDWRFGGNKMWLSYPGISFYLSFDGIYPVPKSVLEKALKKKVVRIEINSSK